MAPPTRTRTRKTLVTAPGEPATEPAEAAPTRRRVTSPRAATARRPATSSRTLRPVYPVEEPVVAETSLLPHAPPTVALSAEAAAAFTAPAVAELLAEPLPVAAPLTESLPAAVLAAEPLPQLIAAPLPDLISEIVPQRASSTLPDHVAELAAAPLPVALQEAAAEVPTIAPTPTSELSGMVELLQADVRALQGLVTEHTEQTALELSRTTMQMVRMVTGMAHHLDQLVEHVQKVTTVAQTLVQSLTRVESTAAVRHARTQERLELLTGEQTKLQDTLQTKLQDTLQTKLQDTLQPLLQEIATLRAQRTRDNDLDRLEQYRSQIELKKLRQAVEQHGAAPALTSPLPRSRGTRR